MAKEEKPQTDLKKKLAAAAGVNAKTIERGGKNLIAVMFGVSERDLEDPAMRAWCLYLLDGTDPSPYVILDKDEKKKEEKDS